MAARRSSSLELYAYHEAMNRSVRNPAFLEKYQESAGTFWRETITCKVTDKRQRSNIPGKGLDVPCMRLATGTEPSEVEKLIRICYSDF